MKNSIKIEDLQTTESFLNSYDTNLASEEFVLFLRPFGNDGYSKPSILDLKNNSDLFSMNYLISTAEEVVCREIKLNFKANIIALANQNLEKVPDFPSYYRCSNENWKLHIELLLKRCLFVVIFLPFDTEIRNSLRWEIFTALCVGLRSRILVIYPGLWNEAKNLTVDKLKEHLEYIDLVSDLSDRSVGFIMKQGNVHKQYYFEEEQLLENGKRYDYTDPAVNISPFIKDMMAVMKKNIAEIPYKNLYSQRNTDLLDYDLTLTDLQMKCIFEDKEALFDMLGL